MRPRNVNQAIAAPFPPEQSFMCSGGARLKFAAKSIFDAIGSSDAEHALRARRMLLSSSAGFHVEQSAINAAPITSPVNAARHWPSRLSASSHLLTSSSPRTWRTGAPRHVTAHDAARLEAPHRAAADDVNQAVISFRGLRVLRLGPGGPPTCWQDAMATR